MFAYSDKGQAVRSIDPGMETEGEVVFDDYATEAQLLEAFPDRAALLAAEVQAATELALVAALEANFDAVAQSHRYDNRLTCALRAGYPGPFQAEGTAFAIWMDDCNAQGYQVMADCLAGKRAIPTAEELIAELPPMVWP